MMKMTWKKFFYILSGRGCFGVTWISLPPYLQCSSPKVCTGTENPLYRCINNPLRSYWIPSMTLKRIYVGEMISITKSLNSKINGWLATQLNGNPHVSLPDGIRNPRIPN